MAGALHRVVLRQLRGARRAAAWRLRRFAKPLPQGSRGAELLPADDSCPRLSLGRVRVDLRARRRGEAVARAGPAFRGRGHLPHHAAALPHLLRGAADARRDRCEANRVRRHPGPHPGCRGRVHVPPPGGLKSDARRRLVLRIEWDVPIRMDDGLVLRADVFRPDERPDAGRHPVILSYGPYAKGLAFQDGYPSAWQRMIAEHPEVGSGSSGKYQNWEVVDPEKWVPQGYACLRIDSRGAGRSPGRIEHFAPRETQDLYQSIEWAGVQPWSSGKVGLNGISYYAINQWHAASLQPLHLAAMCVWEGAADWYRDMTHHGGILCTFWANWYDMQVKTVQYGLGERSPRSRLTDLAVCGDDTLSDKELSERSEERRVGKECSSGRA